MVVDSVLTLDQEDLDEKLIGIKKIPGGAMQVFSFFGDTDI
jgi:T-complex protein 1 subunit eta